MTDKKTKALKLALEANTALREWVNAVPMDTPLPAMPGIDGDWLDSVDATIREALAEQQATEDDTDATIIQYHEATIKRLEARIAELERPVPAPEVRKQQEPVDKRCSPCPEFWDWLPRAYNFEGLGNFTKYNMEVAFLAGMQSTHLPAQHPRVGLTDGEIRLIMDGRGAEGDDNYVEPVFDPFGVDDHSLFAFARAIEAKHGIKGGA